MKEAGDDDESHDFRSTSRTLSEAGFYGPSREVSETTIRVD